MSDEFEIPSDRILAFLVEAGVFDEQRQAGFQKACELLPALNDLVDLWEEYWSEVTDGLTDFGVHAGDQGMQKIRTSLATIQDRMEHVFRSTKNEKVMQILVQAYLARCSRYQLSNERLESLQVSADIDAVIGSTRSAIANFGKQESIPDLASLTREMRPDWFDQEK